MLNVDAKILTEVLAGRLNDVILTLIHKYKMGFMHGKGADINLRTFIRFWPQLTFSPRSSRGCRPYTVLRQPECILGQLSPQTSTSIETRDRVVPCFQPFLLWPWILLRPSVTVCGITIGPNQEKISLYADDTLLYLKKKTDFLGMALSIIDTFGQYSGICINWGKSVLFTLHPMAASVPTNTLLQRVC